MVLCTKCWCCCCLTKDKSVRVCSYLFILYTLITAAINILTSGITASVIFSLAVYVIIIASLILLLIGIRTWNRPCLKQFILVFGVLTVIYFIGTVIIDIICIISYTNADSRKAIDIYRKKIKTNKSDETISTIIRIGAIGLLVSCTLFFILLSHYYCTTRNYVKEILTEIGVKDNEEMVQTEDGKIEETV